MAKTDPLAFHNLVALAPREEDTRATRGILAAGAVTVGEVECGGVKTRSCSRVRSCSCSIALGSLAVPRWSCLALSPPGAGVALLPKMELLGPDS